MSSTVFPPYYGSEWLLFGYQHSSKYLLQQKEKLIQVWNNLRVSKWWQNFHFWMNYSFDVFKVFLQTVMYFRVKWIIKKERKGGKIGWRFVSTNFLIGLRQIWMRACSQLYEMSIVWLKKSRIWIKRRSSNGILIRTMAF